ncbi:hypothetical protein [Priestia abyssalis]|uniref:hypothetical protein n=1 Tax=Priestia abyssalis TaxID=1221450 RepID=UPI001472B9DC|nr:hypothetical protein [Priestia abyssalis]
MTVEITCTGRTDPTLAIDVAVLSRAASACLSATHVLTAYPRKRRTLFLRAMMMLS